MKTPTIHSNDTDHALILPMTESGPCQVLKQAAADLELFTDCKILPVLSEMVMFSDKNWGKKVSPQSLQLKEMLKATLLSWKTK